MRYPVHTLVETASAQGRPDVEPPLESPAEEVTRLRDALAELRSLMTRPGLWAGGEPPGIVTTSVETLFGIANEVEERVVQRRRELVIADEALRESERNSRLVVDSIPGLIAILTAAGELEFVNHQILDYTGRTLDEQKQWATNDNIHPDDRAHVAEVSSESFAAARPYEMVHRLRRSDGIYRWFQNSSFPLRGPSGQIAGWCVLLTDIEDRKRAEDALRESERESRLIVDSIPGLVALLDATGSVELVNPQILQYTGATLEELKRWGTSDLVHPEDLPHVIEIFTRSIASGQPYDIVQRLRRADGVYHWFQNSGCPIRDMNGHVVRWCVLLTDIDERKRAEDALRESEHESRLIVDSIPGLVATLTPTGAIEIVNDQVLTYCGRTLEELQDWATGDAVHPEDLPRVIEITSQSMMSGDPYEIEERIRRFDGVYRWFQVRGLPLRDTSGNIVRWYNLLTDIDERKRAEDALRERERESRQIVDSIPGLVAVFSADGALESVNRQLSEYYGIPMEELGQWKTGNMTHPDDLPRAVEAFTRAIASGQPFDLEVRSRGGDGVYRWLQSRGLPLRDSNGQIVRWYNLLVDIDERKRAEQAVAGSERNLKLIIDTIPALAWSAGPDGHADFFNQHFLDFTGLSMKEASGWGWTAAVHPADMHDVTATWQRIMSSRVPGEGEVRLRRSDGEFRWFLFRANPLRDESGAIVKWYGVNTDIEDRKRAEAAVRASEHDLRRLTETIPEMLWSATPTGAIEYCNTRFLEYTGFSADDVMGDGWQHTIHPDDAARVAPVWMSCVATGTPYRVEVRTFHATDKTYRLCAVNALPLRDEQGHILKWHGTIVDMHDWKQAQEELRNTQAALAHATRVTTMGELTASIAHEVNQPLSGIITNAGTCLRMLDADPPNVDGARETARRTIRDGHRASDVITRLRALFSKKEFTLESLDLNDAILEVIALSRGDLQRNRVVLQSELAGDLPTVTGDRIQLQQVILNLLRNASDAMVDVHDRPRQLLIKTDRKDDDGVLVSVRDAGVGIDAQTMDKLFDAFYTTKSDGMGIGLSISRSIIERHRGRLWAEPNDGPGATFRLSIPCTGEGVPVETA